MASAMQQQHSAARLHTEGIHSACRALAQRAELQDGAQAHSHQHGQGARLVPSASNMHSPGAQAGILSSSALRPVGLLHVHWLLLAILHTKDTGQLRERAESK